MHRHPRRPWAALALAGTLAVTLPSTLAAQTIPLGSALEDYIRLSQLMGRVPLTSVTARTGLAPVPEAAAGLTDSSSSLALERRLQALRSALGASFSLMPVELGMFANSERPWGTNDGAAWAGKGGTLALTGGFVARRGPVTLTLAPTVTYAQNTDFDLSPLRRDTTLSIYAYPTLSTFKMDAPQRFGVDPYAMGDWGQSAIRVDWRSLRAGFSHENMWWGPGIKNSITMTNNAPGFWHAHLGTSRPVGVKIGTIEARWIWGSLRESSFFDTVRTNDRRFITGLVGTFRPRGTKGLEFGATRVFMQAWGSGPEWRDLTLVFLPFQKKTLATPGDPSGTDNRDQLASFFFRWASPPAGFELYGEWGKGDHSWDFRDLFVEPEHASGWLFGFQKLLRRRPEATWRLLGETTILGAARTTRIRSVDGSFFYVHTRVIQGYTNRGQVMGAGIGPGSSQLLFRLDRLSPRGTMGVSFFRTVYDNDRFYRGTSDFFAHEVEPSLTVDGTLMRGSWDLGASLTASDLMNQYYIQRNDHWNVNLALTARYYPTFTR